METRLLFKINHLQHVGIPVIDITRSELFYNRLGFLNVMQSTFTIDGEEGSCIMMKNDLIIIELYQMPGSHLAEIRQRSNGNIDHIAFDVDDIDIAFSTLQSEGFTILEEAPVFLNFWTNGCKYFNITGPDGERLEFNQVL